MKRLGIILIIVTGLTVLVDYTFAQTTGGGVAAFKCIGNLSSHLCPDGLTTGLRGNTGSTASFVSVAGYGAPGDAGGGDFVKLGAASADCQSYSGVTGTGTVGQSKITGLSSAIDTSKLAIGELVSASGMDGSGNTIQTQPGTQIASIGTHQIGLTLALTGTAPAQVTSIPVVITGDNHGTLIIDSQTTPQCWQKTNYRGDPHEYGAIGDGYTDDTGSLQYWLGAYGAPPTAFSSMAPPATNYGPWIATSPANYLVSQPLVCPPYANLQAPANTTSGTPGTGGPGKPPVRIFAVAPVIGSTPGFADAAGFSQPALMMASPYCRISGLALDVNGNGSTYFSSSGTTTISSFTVGLGTNLPPNTIVAGMPISDTDSCIPKGATIATVVSANSVTMSVPATGTCPPEGATETVTITGFYAVDVVGTHVTIDDHALLENGYENVHCADSQVDGLQVKDVEIYKAFQTGINLTGNCDNVRLIGDVLDDNGKQPQSTPPGPAPGVTFSGSDLTLADGIVEESGGTGILFSNSQLGVVSGMVIAGNGVSETTTGQQVAGIEISNASGITITGNQFQGGGSDNSASSGVLLAGTSDNLTFGGNVYNTRNRGNDANVQPSYIYDVVGTAGGTPPLPTLTNTHFYETPAQPGISIFSSVAQALLAPLQIPQFTNNQLSGLTLVNQSPTTPSQVITVQPGSAADSTNSTMITLSFPCTINLAQGGAGGLDTGTSTVNPSTTYYIFIISAAGANPGAHTSSPSCMASRSLTPAFTATGLTGFTNTGYQVEATGGTFATGNVLFNVIPLAGVTAGDAIVSADGTTVPPTTISSFSANTGGNPTVESWGTSSIEVSNITNIYPGMAIVDTGPNHCFPGYARVTSATPGSPYPSITVSAVVSPTCTEAGGVVLSVSGARQPVLVGNAASTNWNTNLIISTGYYRMIGALYTDSSGNFVQFSQNGDRFSLATSVEDISPSLCAVSYPAAKSCALSVPCGRLANCAPGQTVQVEAFGRMLGGATSGEMLLSSLDQPLQPPTPFSIGAPGYTTQNATGETAFPFQLYTDTGGNVQVQAGGAAGTTAYEVTDGWVFHRSQ